jgi:hypothetical protein
MLPSSLPVIERTDYPADNPQWDDFIQRIQIVRYLEEIPINEITERDHEIVSQFITRAQRHFAELDPDFVPQRIKTSLQSKHEQRQIDLLDAR